MTVSRTSLTSLLAALLAAGLGAPAALQAQGQSPYTQGTAYGGYTPGSVVQPTQQSQVYGRPTAPPASYAPPPVNANQYAPSYAPYAGAPYGNPYGSATGGGLTGAANALNASGEFEKQFQQARLMNQDVERSKIDTRRAKIDEWQWERNNMPTLEDNRQRDQYWALRRSLNDVPPAEVWDGSAMNRTLVAIQQQLPPGTTGPTVPLPPGVTNQISLTTGTASTGNGLLKNGPKLRWPYALSDDAFDAQRADIDKLMKTAYDQVTAGQVDFKVLRELNKDLDQMQATLKAKIEDMTPTANVQGNRYVRELRDTAKALENPDATALFAADRSDTVRSVGDLVRTMTAKGQKFAPALAGSEPAYNALYSSLVTYYTALTQPTIRTAPPPPGVGATGSS
jgi:hypothetical protein